MREVGVEVLEKEKESSFGSRVVIAFMTNIEDLIQQTERDDQLPSTGGFVLGLELHPTIEQSRLRHLDAFPNFLMFMFNIVGEGDVEFVGEEQNVMHVQIQLCIHFRKDILCQLLKILMDELIKGIP